MFFLKDALASQVAKTSMVFQTNASRHVCESKALPERQECSWGNLEIVQKPVFFFVGVFFRLFQAVSKNSPLSRFDCLIVSVLFCCKNHGKSLWFCLWCHQFPVSRNHYLTGPLTWFLWIPRHRPWRSICRRTKSRGRLQVFGGW